MKRSLSLGVNTISPFKRENSLLKGDFSLEKSEISLLVNFHSEKGDIFHSFRVKFFLSF